MNDYDGLMEAILSLQQATAEGLDRVRTDFRTELGREIGSLRSDMNKRFDRVDDRVDHVDRRFHRLEHRVARFEPQGERPAS